jgi:dipeptidyl aminopeptidase/acylaminoacyl peptidase
MKTLPYGEWKSPISSEMVFSGSPSDRALSQLRLFGKDLYWLEMRSTEGGRNVIVHRKPDGEIEDCIPREFNARTRVHEYGGGDYTVVDGEIFFSNFSDQGVYRCVPGQEPQLLTEIGEHRYADFHFDHCCERLICVREDHHDPQNVVNSLVSISLDDGGLQVLVEGNDFYASPRLSPNGERLAWLTWNHPNMPWDGVELWISDVRPDGSLYRPHCVAGSKDESIFQPEWAADNSLYFISDRSGWWNLYHLQGDELQELWPMEADFGLPQWSFGLKTYAFETTRMLICSYKKDGRRHLARLDTITDVITPIEIPYSQVTSVEAGNGKIYCVASSPSRAREIIQIDLKSHQVEILRILQEIDLDEGYLSKPQFIEFPTENGLTAFANFYPPHNKDFSAPKGELPPLLTLSHGGPTGETSDSLRLSIQYWTSRGFAIVDVDYGGSSGYGRAYRQRLNGNWGIVDVEDCVNAARYLANQGLVDGTRMTITGGSAGGYTTLCALIFHDVFKAGGCHFGVSDLEALAIDTHKFESRYLDNLIGPYPQSKELYKARSPIHHTQRLSCPVIFFQGLDDPIVPPAQSEKMYVALKTKGLPTAYLSFEGESHGFRKPENNRRALEAEYYFFSRIFKFSPADPIEPFSIDHMNVL